MKDNISGGIFRRVRKCGMVGIIDDPLYHNEGVFNLRKYLAKKRVIILKILIVIFKNGVNPIVKMYLGLWYRLLALFKENGKRGRFMGYPHLTLGMYFLRVILRVQYLLRR